MSLTVLWELTQKFKMFFKKKIIIFVYNAYVDGLSLDEIAFKFRIWHKYEISFEDINEIIDLTNTAL